MRYFVMARHRKEIDKDYLNEQLKNKKENWNFKELKTLTEAMEYYKKYNWRWDDCDCGIYSYDGESWKCIFN